MKLLIFAIYDTAAESYMSPFFVKTQAEAMRGFSDAAANPDTPIGKHPADYHLFQLGEYTDHNGDLRKQEPTCIISALEARTPQRQSDEE